MYATSIEIDSWRGNVRNDITLRCKDVSDVERALRHLDGHRTTEVEISGSGERSMIVSGGNDSRYLVICFVNQDGDSYTLGNSKAEEGVELMVTAGGQPAEFPAAKIVDLETAIEAATHFALTGQRVNSRIWIKEY